MFFVVALMAFAIQDETLGQTKNTIIVRSDQLLCVVEHFDQYTQSQGDKFIVVILDLCPDPKITAEAISTLSVALDPDPAEKSDVDTIQKVISFNAAEIQCLMGRVDKFKNALADKETVDVNRILSAVC